MIFKLILLATIVLFSGCSMSKETHTEAKNIETKIESTVKSIKEKEKAFANDKDAKELAVYVKKENLTKSFSNARTTLEKAKTQYNNELLPLMKKNDNDDENKALSLIGSINTQLRMSNLEASNPSRRITELKDFIKNKDSFYKKAKGIKTLSNNKTNTFKALTAKAEKEYPAKKDDLQKRFLGMKTIDNNISTLFTTLESEYSNDTPDFSTFSKSYAEMTKKEKESFEYSATQTKKVNELFQSYSKILTDMRERYYITIGRLSWHEGEEYPDETTYIFPKRELSAKTFEYFDSVSEEEMGSLSGGWGSGSSLSTNWNSYFVSQLNLNVEEGMPSGDNSADFWIESLYTENFHKYTIIKNGVKHETDWESVTPEYFDANAENMGMEIVSKPYGFYEDEKITTAGPAGMGYVGNKQYGEWKSDSSGTSFWTYYGMYSFMNNMTGMNHGYSRDDYNNYHTNRKNNQGYYGKKDEYGTYGSSTYKNSKYSKSEYARNHKGEINSAKRQSSNGPLRNAGHNARGRGPGGGGK